MTSKPGHRTYYAIAEVRISSVSKTHEKKKTKQTSSVLLTINSYRQKKKGPNMTKIHFYKYINHANKNE